MTRPQQRDHILQLLEQTLAATESLLENVAHTVENLEPHFSHTDRFQTLEQTQAELEEAVEAVESAREAIGRTQFPPMMARRSQPTVAK